MSQRFPYIWADGKLMGSSVSYIRDQEEDAIATNAPEGAYAKAYAKDGSGWDGKTWYTVDDIPNAEYRRELEQMAERYK